MYGVTAEQYACEKQNSDLTIAETVSDQIGWNGELSVKVLSVLNVSNAIPRGLGRRLFIASVAISYNVSYIIGLGNDFSVAESELHTTV